MAASAALLASSFAVALTHPIDTLKTLRQAGTNNEPLGVRRLYKGVLSNILKEAPNAAIYLACYELFKSWLLRIPVFAGVPLLAMCVAGMLGDAVGSVVRVPAEIINKRLQLGLSSSWSSAIRDGFMSESGVQGTIASWEAVLWRDVPYGGLQIAGYEAVRMLLMRFGLCGLALSIVAGAVAGWIAAVVTTPADVLVTRMSTQRPQCYLETKHYMSPIATFTRIWRDEGFAALWTGATHRGLFYMPMIALFFAAYETFKFVIMNPHRARQIVLAAVLSFAKAGLVNAEAFAAAFHVPLYVAALVVAHSIVAGRGKRTAV